MLVAQLMPAAHCRSKPEGKARSALGEVLVSAQTV